MICRLKSFFLGIFNVSHALSYLCIFPCFLGLCHFDNVLFLSQDEGMKIDWSEIFDVPAEKFFLGYLWCFSCIMSYFCICSLLVEFISFL